MKTQHVLMREIQTTLEKACYNFGLVHMPRVLKKKGWNCAEGVELNCWQKVIIEAEDKLSTEAAEMLGKSVPELMTNIANIRHTAVHRVPVTVAKIESFLIDATSLTRLLMEDAHCETIARLRQKTESVVEDIKRNKDLLEARSADALKRIRRQQAALERKMQTMIEDMLREDKEFQSLRGESLEQAIMQGDDLCKSRLFESDEQTAEHSICDVPDEGTWKECDILGDVDHISA